MMDPFTMTVWEHICSLPDCWFTAQNIVDIIKETDLSVSSGKIISRLAILTREGYLQKGIIITDKKLHVWSKKDL